MPPEVEHLWDWFCELAACRTSNGFAVNPISYVDIASWAALTGSEPTTWEVRALLSADRAVRAVGSQGATPSSAPDPKMRVEVPVSDTQGVKSILSRLAARHQETADG